MLLPVTLQFTAGMKEDMGFFNKCTTYLKGSCYFSHFGY